MEDRSDDVEKKRVYSPEEMEKGICPRCGGEVFGSQALCLKTGLYVRFECRSCSFVTKVKKELDPQKWSN